MGEVGQDSPSTHYKVGYLEETLRGLYRRLTDEAERIKKVLDEIDELASKYAESVDD